MTRISAAGNHFIEMHVERWQLLQRNEDGTETVIFSVSPGQPMRYTSAFATSRHLPSGGVLPAEHIRQVVVGWSHEDESWHLGMLLVQDLADVRGSRWCEIAWWPDPDLNVFGDMAQKAGQTLAQALVRPFYRVEPRPDKKPPEPPMPELPLNLGLWKMRRMDANQLELKRSTRWTASQSLRLLWYAFWGVVYLALSLMTLRADLALPNAGTLLPNPDILPYLGLATAAVLGLMTLSVLYQLLTSPNRIVVDGAEHRIMGLRGNTKRWEKPASNLCDVYVSEVVKVRGKKRTVYHGELNLRLANGSFYCLIEQPDKKEANLENGYKATVPSDEDTLLTIVPGETLDDLQAAGLHIAKTMGDLPCWYDHRAR